MDTHMGENRELVKCKLCKASLTSTKGLQKHISIVHEGKRPYKCDICCASFSINGNLRKHFKTNLHKIKALMDPLGAEPRKNTERQYFCPHCPGVSFVSNTGLRKHAKIHEEYPKCNF